MGKFWAFPLLMLGINSLGVVIRLWLDGKSEWLSPPALATSILVLFIPLLPLALLANFHVRRAPLEAWLGSVLAAMTGAYCCFVLLDPEMNHDANIGLGLYLIFGVAFPLGAAYLLGTLLGKVIIWARH